MAGGRRRDGEEQRLPGIRGRRGQTLTEYILLVLFVVVGLLIVLVEFEEVLVRLYKNAVTLVFGTFP